MADSKPGGAGVGKAYPPATRTEAGMETSYPARNRSAATGCASSSSGMVGGAAKSPKTGVPLSGALKGVGSLK